MVDRRMGTSERSIKLRDSLRFRLSASIGIAVIITLLFSTAIVSWVNFSRDIKLEVSRIKAVTTVLATSIAADMAEGNRPGVQNGLTSIRAFQHLEYAAVVKPEGQRFTEMGVSSFLLKPNIDLRKQSAFELLFQNKIWVETKIVKGGEHVGNLQVLSNIAHLKTAFIKNIFISLLVALATMIVSIMFSLRSVKRIVKPVTRLSYIMRQAGSTGEFSERVSIDDRGEVGMLAESFNTMLSQIETRDGQLSDYRVNLENKVEKRTEQLKIARDQAETANAAKSDFLATMSHEIRTPMNGMMVMAEMLAAAPLNSRHRRYANVISRSGAGLLGIINDILDFSKIEAGQLELEETRVEIDNLVGDVANLFWDKANEKSLELVTQVGKNVPVALIGDPTRIGQVVTNLVNNALKFTSDGGVIVKVLQLDAIGNNSHLRFEITDTGIGIAPDKQREVFERFSQADQSTTRNYGGTGLGLSICQKLVEAMGGKIGLDSVVGEGSTFWFEIELPIEDGGKLNETINSDLAIDLVCENKLLSNSLCELFHERGISVNLNRPSIGEVETRSGVIVADTKWIKKHELSLRDCSPIAITAIGDTLSDQLIMDSIAKDLIRLPAARSEIDALCKRIVTSEFLGTDALEGSDENAQEFRNLEGITVLAVDDNAVNREVLRDALGVLNVEVALAESGEQAIDMLDEHAFDLVFMDCSMPGIDGFEATQIIRDREQTTGVKRVPIVALTAHVTGADAEKWRHCGMDGYLAKPFTIEGLSTQIVDTCGQDTNLNSSEEMPADVSAETDEQQQPRVAIDPEEEKEVVLINDVTLDFINSLGKSSTVNMAAKIFGLYIEHAPSGVKSIVEAGCTENYTELSKSAHALKSMSLSAGAKAVGDLCQIIEDDAKGKRCTDCQKNVALLNSLFDDTIKAMKEHISKSSVEVRDGEDINELQNLG